MQIFILYSYLLLPLEFLSVVYFLKENLKKKNLINYMGLTDSGRYGLQQPLGRQHSEDLPNLGVDDCTATQRGVFQTLL